MYKVTIKFRDGSPDKSFYASESYSSSNGGTMLYWNNEDDTKIISVPVDLIKEIEENEVE